MTPEELQHQMKSFNLNSTSLGERLGVSRQQVYNWRKGHNQIPHMVDVIFDLWTRFGMPPRGPEAKSSNAETPAGDR